jgi:hypothetical protein
MQGPIQDVQDKIKSYKSLVELAFKNAENNESKITQFVVDMQGMSGLKTRHFYNNLLNFEDARYLEIGTWLGSSVCSAMCGNKATVVCMDNWSQLDGPKQAFMKNFEKCKGENNATFIETDCFDVDVTSLPKFNVYMYDGDHTQENHSKALTHFYNCLDDVFIFVVDDWNWKLVRDGTMSAIKQLKLKTVFQKEIRLTKDDSHTPWPLCAETWHNGIYVAILQKTSA